MFPVFTKNKLLTTYQTQLVVQLLSLLLLFSHFQTVQVCQPIYTNIKVTSFSQIKVVTRHGL